VSKPKNLFRLRRKSLLQKVPKAKNKKLPQDVVDHWPEVFKDVDIKVVPVKYLHSVRVFFTDGKVWDIDVAKTRQKKDAKDIEASLEELFSNYQDSIDNVDFRLDTARVKSDIQGRTRSFMKKRK
jgi:hypothetical protein